MATNIPILFEMMSKLKITHQQLSDNIGVSVGNISDWKSGRSSPNIKVLPKIADYLDCSVDYLLGRTENPKSHKPQDGTLVNNAPINGDYNMNVVGANYPDRDKIKTFYHVSSFIHENLILTKEGKPHQEMCNLICGFDISTLSKCEVLFNIINKLNINTDTGRQNDKWLCEAIFEYIRKIEYPNNPSRMWGLFVVSTYEEAKKFNLNYRNGNAKIFEIKQPIENAFKYDMYFFDLAHQLIKNSGLNYLTFGNACENARYYWQHKQCIENSFPEYIIDGIQDIYVGEEVKEISIAARKGNSPEPKLKKRDPNAKVADLPDYKGGVR